MPLHLSGRITLDTRPGSELVADGATGAERTAVPAGAHDPDPEGGSQAKRQPVKKYHLHPFVTQFLRNPLEWTAEQHLDVLRDRITRAERKMEDHTKAVELHAAASAEGIDFPAPELSLPTEAWRFEHEARLTNPAKGVPVLPLREVLSSL